MNTQTVSPATAAKLAAAGFPQPAPAPGQWWSYKESVIFIWYKTITPTSIRDYYTVSKCINGHRPTVDEYFDLEDFNGLVFLPTAGDILRELQQKTRTPFWWAITPISSEGVWCCIQFEGYEGKNLEFENEHPAEAAALAWLEINKG